MSEWQRRQIAAHEQDGRDLLPEQVGEHVPLAFAEVGSALRQVADSRGERVRKVRARIGRSVRDPDVHVAESHRPLDRVEKKGIGQFRSLPGRQRRAETRFDVAGGGPLGENDQSGHGPGVAFRQRDGKARHSLTRTEALSIVRTTCRT